MHRVRLPGQRDSGVVTIGKLVGRVDQCPAFRGFLRRRRPLQSYTALTGVLCRQSLVRRGLR
eukprot:3177301-Prymnesium_polylepis.1